jgi:hypothetical protein
MDNEQTSSGFNRELLSMMLTGIFVPRLSEYAEELNNFSERLEIALGDRIRWYCDRGCWTIEYQGLDSWYSSPDSREYFFSAQIDKLSYEKMANFLTASLEACKKYIYPEFEEWWSKDHLLSLWGVVLAGLGICHVRQMYEIDEPFGVSTQLVSRDWSIVYFETPDHDDEGVFRSSWLSGDSDEAVIEVRIRPAKVQVRFHQRSS